MSDLVGGLADLVLPATCAGCDTGRVPLRYGVCARCAVALESLTPFLTAPSPRPVGLPSCIAVGPYGGPLRGALLAYKERGRHRLARPLGHLLAGAVAEFLAPGEPVTLIPVPSTASAARARRGDHMARLATHAARRLRSAGHPADVSRPLRAVPRPDSVSLDASARAAAAENSLRLASSPIRLLRRGRTMRGTVVVVDDIVTTGSTLTAVTSRLREADMRVAGAALLAATRLRRSASTPRARMPARGDTGPRISRSVSSTGGDGRASAG